jgi:hypothetical protein
VKLYACVLLLALAAVPVLAADVDGRWAGTVSTPMGDVPVAFQFKADGAALTGSTTGPDGAAIPIHDGKIDGDNIAFVVTFDFGQKVDLTYTGVVAGDQIQMKVDFAGMPFEFVVKRVS